MLNKLLLHNPTKHEWIKYVKTRLCSSGFSGVWEQQLVHDQRKFIKHFEQRCRDTVACPGIRKGGGAKI